MVYLACYRQHADWNMDQWVTVLFNDESSFSRDAESQRTFICREPGTGYLHSNVHEIENYGGKAQCSNFGGVCASEFILMDNNARPYRAPLLLNEFLESENIHRMDWPARFSDLNPIEQVLDSLGRQLPLAPYSSDLVPKDYHLFLALQNFKSDKNLESREDSENQLHEVFDNKSQDFYDRGNMKLPFKW
ncbi:uncharacterized protein TNCV_2166961 [Trichonephila clavipes]|nr:uncharacterized protein TNCV_2166961 [Trichonephila clavipes]